jgi:hypothetical protein
MKVSEKTDRMKQEGGAMNSIAQIVQALEGILQGEKLEAVGREKGFIKRLRELSCADVVQTLIFGWLQDPAITLEGQSQVLQRREVSVTSSALS